MARANAKAHAVDQGGDRYWVLAFDATLRGYRIDGTQLVNVTPPTSPSGGDTIALAVDVYDGSVRLGFGTKLYHFAIDGSLVRTITLGSTLKAMAVDPVEGNCVVVTANSVVGYGRGGTTSFTISQSGGVGIALDSYTGEFFVPFASTLKQFSADGTELASTSLSGGGPIGIDGLGGAWVAAGATLYQYDVALTQRQSITPFGSGTISEVESDPFDGGVWVAYLTSARHYTIGGALDATLSSSDDIRELSLAKDVYQKVGEWEGKESNGIRLLAGTTYWEVGSIWGGSGGRSANVEIGDKLTEINGVAAPSSSATASQMDEFYEDVIFARSGSSDTYEFLRGATPITTSVTFSDLITLLRNASFWTFAFPLPAEEEEGPPSPDICFDCDIAENCFPIANGYEICDGGNGNLSTLPDCLLVGDDCSMLIGFQ